MRKHVIVVNWMPNFFILDFLNQQTVWVDDWLIEIQSFLPEKTFGFVWNGEFIPSFRRVTGLHNLEVMIPLRNNGAVESSVEDLHLDFLLRLEVVEDCNYELLFS